MSEPVLRIFSYLPNPRVWKSLIAADLCGVHVEVTGDKPSALSRWLWDYDARELEDAERDPDNHDARTSRRGFSGTLFKTDAFLEAHPFGTVPAAFGPGGWPGIFESNSILRAVARAGETHLPLYGQDGYEASRIDSFLDADLIFAREAQVYLLALGDSGEELTEAIYQRMAAAYEFYLAGLENALGHGPYLAGSSLSIADISFVCDVAQFLREGHYLDALEKRGLGLVSAGMASDYPRTHEHLLRLAGLPEFSAHLGSYLDWYLSIGTAAGSTPDQPS